MTVDGASAAVGSGAITVKELVGTLRFPPPVPAPTSSSTDALTAGETGLYEITVASGCDATYGDLNQDGRVDLTDLVILSHYLVGNMVPGCAPFTSALTKRTSTVREP